METNKKKTNLISKEGMKMTHLNNLVLTECGLPGLWQRIRYISLWEYKRARSPKHRLRMKYLKSSSTKFPCREHMCQKRNKR